MRDRFERQLQRLKDDIITLGELCVDSISYAVESFITGDKELAKKAHDIEAEINEQEKHIEQECLKLLLKQQPMATDLRTVSAALKMITDLERIGDQANDIARLSKKSAGIETSDNFKKIAEETVNMVKNSVKSYVDSDLRLAISVIERDDIVDNLFESVKKEVILDIKSGRDGAEKGVDILMIAKYLERISDHATNVAEWVEFAITGLHTEK